MRQHLAAMGLCMLMASGLTTIAVAQSTDSSVEKRIRALEARVTALEQREASSHPASPPAPAMSMPTAPPPTRLAPPAAPAQTSTTRTAVVANWSALHRGMSQRQVGEALGMPDSKQVRPMTEIWFYPGNRTVLFDRNGALDSWTH